MKELLVKSGFNVIDVIGEEILSPFDDGENIENITHEIKTGTEYNNRTLYAIKVTYDDVGMYNVTSKVSSFYNGYSKLPNAVGDNQMIFFFFSKNKLNSQVLEESENYKIEICASEFVKIDEHTKLMEKINGFDFADMVIDDIRVFNNVKVEKTYTMDEVKENLDLLGSEFYSDQTKINLVVEALGNTFIGTAYEDDCLNLINTFISQNKHLPSTAPTLNKWMSLRVNKTEYTLVELFKNIKELSDYDKFNKVLTSSSVSIPTLKDIIKKYKLKDYEIELSLDNIQYALEKSEGKKVSATTIRKIIKDIEKDNEENLAKISIGLDNTLAQIVMKNKFDNGKNFVNINGNVFFYENGCWRMSDIPSVQKKVLDGIRDIIFSDNKEYDAIKSVIYLKKMNDSIDSLTNNITNLILKDSAEPEYRDTLNLRNTRESNFSIINTINKEVYITDGVVTTKNHSYDSYLTTQYNVVYDETADCPNWDQMIERLFADCPDRQEMVRHFYEVIGYSIQNKKERPLVVIFLGSGKNGKTFLLNQISKMLGVDTVLTANIAKFFEGAHSTASLVGKTWLVDDDWKKGQLLPDDQLKSLSENKTVTANPKGKATFNFVSNVTPFINSNSSPRTKDTSEGMVRRVQVFEFTREIKDSEQDPMLAQKLDKERSGLLNKLIEGYIRYVKRGYRFELPLSLQKSNREWFKASNPLVAYLDEKFVFTGDMKDTIKLQTMFEGYQNYLSHENSSNHSVTRNNFRDELKNMGSSRNISVVKNSHDTTFYVHGVKHAQKHFDAAPSKIF